MQTWTHYKDMPEAAVAPLRAPCRALVWQFTGLFIGKSDCPSAVSPRSHRAMRGIRREASESRIRRDLTWTFLRLIQKPQSQLTARLHIEERLMAGGCRGWSSRAGGLRDEQKRRFIDELEEDVQLSRCERRWLDGGR